ncbi:MAG: YbaB/EbfC family nucleoid-associated protein [Acidimicrobiales bacterium]
MSPDSEPPHFGESDDEDSLGPEGLGIPRGFGALSGLSDLLGQAREQLEEVSQHAVDVTILGRAGDGAVEIELTGNLEAIGVKITPEVVDPADIAMLEDLVLAALRDALSQAVEVREQAASTFLAPGLDLGTMLGSLFGNGPPGGGLPDLGGLDLGDLDLGDLMGGLFGGQAGSGGGDTGESGTSEAGSGPDEGSR